MDRAEQVRQIFSYARLDALPRISTVRRNLRPFLPVLCSQTYTTTWKSLSDPTIHQLLALSHITNYRLCDWLAVFRI